MRTHRVELSRRSLNRDGGETDDEGEDHHRDEGEELDVGHCSVSVWVRVGRVGLGWGGVVGDFEWWMEKQES